MAKAKIAVEVVEVVEVVKALSIGAFCKDKILNTNWTNMEILDSVKSTYPNAKTSYACIAWYRSDLRSKGEIGPRVHAKKVVPVQLEMDI